MERGVVDGWEGVLTILRGFATVANIWDCCPHHTAFGLANANVASGQRAPRVFVRCKHAHLNLIMGGTRSAIMMWPREASQLFIVFYKRPATKWPSMILISGSTVSICKAGLGERGLPRNTLPHPPVRIITLGLPHPTPHPGIPHMNREHN